MKLLICTQAVDQNDPVLGFFHLWLEEFSGHFNAITVLCLREGTHTLPSHVRVLSLGRSRFMRVANLLRQSLGLRSEYDAVLVHMSQEFLLVGGPLWKLLGKRVYMWRNHYAGSFLTGMAAAFCNKVFYTSRLSYTARYKKAVRMPVGVDTQIFKPVSGVERKPRSALFLARMAPSKRPHLLIDALAVLKKKGVDLSVSFYGSSLPQDREYYEQIRREGEFVGATFYPGIPNREAPSVYSAHEIFVNCSPSGMFDKTIFEAAACGCKVLASSTDWKEIAGENYWFAESGEALAQKLAALLEAGTQGALMHSLSEEHSLRNLGMRLKEEIVL